MAATERSTAWTRALDVVVQLLASLGSHWCQSVRAGTSIDLQSLQDRVSRDRELDSPTLPPNGMHDSKPDARRPGVKLSRRFC